jgi:hypothetical protein
MDARKTMRTASLRRPREAIREVAEGSAAQDRNQAEGSDGNARACVKAVQQEHQPDNHDGRDCE